MLGKNQRVTSLGIIKNFERGHFEPSIQARVLNMLNIGYPQKSHRKYCIIISLIFFTEPCVLNFPF